MKKRCQTHWSVTVKLIQLSIGTIPNKMCFEEKKCGISWNLKGCNAYFKIKSGNYVEIAVYSAFRYAIKHWILNKGEFNSPRFYSFFQFGVKVLLWRGQESKFVTWEDAPLQVPSKMVRGLMVCQIVLADWAKGGLIVGFVLNGCIWLLCAHIKM